MSTLENVDSHAQLVQRARKHIKQFGRKLLGRSDGTDERQEQDDIIAGAFEIAARQLTSENGSFLNTDYRSGHIDSFRGGTADLDRRMTNRFVNHQEGRGTRYLIGQINEANRARAARAAAKAAAKRAKMKTEGERMERLASEWRAKKLTQKKAEAVRKRVNQTTRTRATGD